MQPIRERADHDRPRVLVTRPEEQADELCRLLLEAGMQPVRIPTIAIEPLDDLAALDAAIGRLHTFRYAVFPSANAAMVFLARRRILGAAAPAAPQLRVVAGPSTAAVLAGAGIAPAIVPNPFGAEAALAALASEPLAGARVLLPRALEGREAFAEGLRARGAEVEEVAVYRTAPVAESPALVDEVVGGGLAAITFLSPSAVRGFTLCLERARVRPDALLSRPLVACIGATTAAEAARRGWPAAVIAPATTAESLVGALRGALTASRICLPELVAAR